jgi:hypothetical protein
MSIDAKAGQVEGAQPHKGSMDTHDAIEHILMKPEEPLEEDTPKAEKDTAAAEAATTSKSTDQFSEELEAVEEISEESETTEEEATEEEQEEPEATEEEEETEVEATPEAAEAAEEEEEADATPMFTTPEGEEVTLEELKRGFLRQSDYTQKTQEVAEARRELGQQFQQTQQHQLEVAQNLRLALDVVEPQLAAFASTDWEALAATDAYEYAEKRALFDQAQARYSQLRSAAEQTVALSNAQKEVAKQQMLAQERQKLQMALPDMADPVEGRRLASSIKEYAMTMGLSESEASNIVDHRLIVALNKARMFDELDKSKLSASRKKIHKGPKKVLKGGQPTTKTQQKAAANKAKRSKLRNSGSIDDAVDWLMSGG